VTCILALGTQLYLINLSIFTLVTEHTHTHTHTHTQADTQTHRHRHRHRLTHTHTHTINNASNGMLTKIEAKSTDN
jgi:hypothetical protein